MTLRRLDKVDPRVDALVAQLATFVLRPDPLPLHGDYAIWDADLGRWVGVPPPEEPLPVLRARKIADTSRATATIGHATFLDDPHLAVYLPVAGTYRFRCEQVVDGPTDGRYKHGWRADDPAIFTADWSLTVSTQNLSTVSGTATTAVSNADLARLTHVIEGVAGSGTARSGLPGVGVPITIISEGTWTVTEPTTVHLAWTQNTSGITTATTLRRGSELTVGFIGDANSGLLSGTQVTFSNDTTAPLTSTTFTLQSPEKPHSFAYGVNYARYELREADMRGGELENGRTLQRVELAGPRFFPLNTDVWYSGSYRVTGDLSTNPEHMLLFLQFLQRPEAALGEVSKMPALAFLLRDGRLVVQTTGDPEPITTERRLNINERYSEPWVDNGQWINLVIRARFHWETGQLQVWKNGVELCNLTGILMGYNDTAIAGRPRAKTGMYRSNVPLTQVVELANAEATTSSLLDRVANPLPLPVIP